MIKRETIKQAIDAISGRDAGIGYALDEMLAVGLIGVPSGSEETLNGDEFYFFFENQKVPVNKYLYISQGTAPIEQGLLIKYGELLKKQELQDEGKSIEYKDAAREVRTAGLKLAVTHEVDYAIARATKQLRGLEESNIEVHRALISFLEMIKRDNGSLKIAENGAHPGVLYQGVVDVATPACFMRFLFCTDSLMRVADIDLEFFYVRFILNCLARGLGKNLFTCVVDDRIVGLLYVTFKERVFYKGVEVKFMATLGGKTGNQTEPTLPALKGVGTFLLAGVWLLWKNELVDVKEIFLDAVIEAKRFYESAGFQPRGRYAYVLKNPKGYLVKAILIMANNCRDLRQSVIKEIGALIKKQVKGLRKKAGSEKEKSARKVVIASIKECLKAGARAEFSRTAVMNLIKYKNKIPEAEELIQFALAHASGEAKAELGSLRSQLK